MRQRIHSTYAYLAGGAAVAAASATALVRSPAFVRAMAGGRVLAPLAMLAASIGAGVVCQVRGVVFCSNFPGSGVQDHFHPCINLSRMNSSLLIQVVIFLSCLLAF